MIAGFREFEFDLPHALLQALVAVLDELQAALLSFANLDKIPEAQGIYLLLQNTDIVYVGKTDSEAGLKQRLKRHAETIQHRKDLNPQSIHFKAVRIFVFTPMDLETQLIAHYSKQSKVSWNNSGFGSNDPGRNRDLTELKAVGFDAQYPIDLDRQISPTHKIPRDGQASEILAALKKAVPYTLRFEGQGGKSRKPHPELDKARIKLPPGPLTARIAMTEIVKGLPVGWQATLLAGRIILYKDGNEYKYGSIIARSA